jgi:hypothetical protein
LLEALREEAHYAPHRLIIDHGTAFGPAELPTNVPPGEVNCCFYNAFTLAGRHPGLYTYFEGFATYEPEAACWPVRHAWCSDHSGAAIDPTWTDPTIRPLATAAWRSRWSLSRHMLAGTPAARSMLSRDRSNSFTSRSGFQHCHRSPETGDERRSPR